MAHEVNSKNPGELTGISAKTNDIHHGKLYTGYVNKRNEVEEKLKATESEGFDSANQIYSAFRGLKEGETFAANGMILHEVFFDILGGDGEPKGKLYEDIVSRYGSYEMFEKIFTASGMVARGWAILAYDPSDETDKRLHIFTADSQNQGGVWGATPLITLDVYEHAYMIDFGADRKAYINTFMQNLDWDKLNARYLHIKKQ